MNLINIILFASPNGQQATNGGGFSFFFFIILMMLIMWLFMIRPQQKKNKEAQKFRDSLEKGTKVITIGGLHGKICDIQDDTVCLETEDGSKIRVEKNAIAQNAIEKK